MEARLLYNGPSVPSIYVAHFTEMSETYESIEMLLKLIKNYERNWMVGSDLKVVSLILGIQSGYTKFPYFLCLWDS